MQNRRLTFEELAIEEEEDPGILRKEMDHCYASLFLDPDYHLHPGYNSIHLRCSHREFKLLHDWGEIPATSTIRRSKYSLSCFFS